MGCDYLMKDGFCELQDAVTGGRVICPKHSDDGGCAEWKDEEPCDVGEVVEQLGDETDFARKQQQYALEKWNKDVTPTQEAIRDTCNEIMTILINKNRKYGDSAIHPKRIFSRADAVEQINVRIDDKISRIQSAQDDDTEDAELDLIGYLVLKRVAKRINEAKEGK